MSVRTVYVDLFIFVPRFFARNSGKLQLKDGIPGVSKPIARIRGVTNAHEKGFMIDPPDRLDFTFEVCNCIRKEQKEILEKYTNQVFNTSDKDKTNCYSDVRFSPVVFFQSGQSSFSPKFQ